MSTKKEKLEKYDARGVQTLFRTLSRNHYNLLRMVDNKASIILTVNSIIISLMMGVIFISPTDQQDVLQVGSKILLNCGMASMVFALLAMLPHRYSKKVKNSGVKGSLYAGSYSKMSLAEYEAEMQRIIDKGATVYEEMIKDLYLLGKSIAIKQKLIWISVAIFLLGLSTASLHTLSHGIVLEEMFFNK